MKLNSHGTDPSPRPRTYPRSSLRMRVVQALIAAVASVTVLGEELALFEGAAHRDKVRIAKAATAASGVAAGCKVSLMRQVSDSSCQLRPDKQG